MFKESYKLPVKHFVKLLPLMEISPRIKTSSSHNKNYVKVTKLHSPKNKKKKK